MFRADRNYRDIVGGGLLVVIGIYVVVEATATLRVGELVNMGPGLFPVSLGVIMTALGLLIGLPALVNSGEPMKGDFRSTFFVAAGMLLFGAIVGLFGLVPAVVILIVVASRADSKLSIPKAAVYGVILATVAALMFRYGLSMRLPLFVWPW